MTGLYTLLALALCSGVGLAALVVEELLWETRNRLPRCPTCSELHPRHAAHR
jgi:hypothetical protein